MRNEEQLCNQRSSESSEERLCQKQDCPWCFLYTHSQDSNLLVSPMVRRLEGGKKTNEDHLEPKQ